MSRWKGISTVTQKMGKWSEAKCRVLNRRNFITLVFEEIDFKSWIKQPQPLSCGRLTIFPSINWSPFIGCWQLAVDFDYCIRQLNATMARAHHWHRFVEASCIVRRAMAGGRKGQPQTLRKQKHNDGLDCWSLSYYIDVCLVINKDGSVLRGGTEVDAQK